MAKIKSFIKPSRLYRYRSIDKIDRELAAIQEGYLYCAPFEQLNDPMEGLFASSQRVRQSENYRDVRAAIVDQKAAVGICSFSEVNDNELMWAHYASQFKGICVGYNLSRLLNNLNEDAEFVRVYYNEDVPQVRHTSTPPRLLAKKILSCKYYRWLYEREWRLFSELGKLPYQDKSCATHVYLGSRMTETNRNKVVAALQGLPIHVSDMSVEKYSISFIAASAG
jgi:Protein of unknown function (DUF2971)